MGLPKYILNIDELAKLIKDGVSLQANVTTGGMEGLLKEYFDELLNLLRQILEGSSVKTQRLIGLHSYIPALAFDYELIHVFDEDVYITGITYSQTGWKVLDCFSLYIGDELLFDGSFTKEFGEYKHFNAFYSVSAGTEIKIVYHNNSGNSKQVWFDIEYLAKRADIPTGRDWVITVSWENGWDIDCCWADASTGDILTGYSTGQLGAEPNRLFKDRDDTAVNDSETWSIEGKYIDRVIWGLGWYRSKGPANAEITITLYDGSGNAVNVINDITGDMLEAVDNRSGNFLCVYEFDLTNPVYSSQWTRINRRINQ